MKVKKKEHIKKTVMNIVKKASKFLLILILLVGFSQCKTQNGTTKVPFEISEKTYFNFAGGKKGISGTTIKLVGKATTLNLTFSTIFFQNHEYKIVPDFRGDQFNLIGTNTKLIKGDMNMHQDAVGEYGNKAPDLTNKIPFELLNNEAILVYRINAKDFYYKIKNIKQLDDVYYP